MGVVCTAEIIVHMTEAGEKIVNVEPFFLFGSMFLMLFFPLGDW
jgi:hypothetical protein